MADPGPAARTVAARDIYQAEALMVTDPTANCTVSPFATPVMLDVRAPCSQRSGVPAVSQISMDVIVVQDPVALQETALLLVCCPADGDPNPEDPNEDPPAVYPGQLPDVASVPLELLVPCAVISRRCSGGVMVNAEPPEVPGVMVNVVELVNRAWMIALTRVWSVMFAMAQPSGWPGSMKLPMKMTGRQTVHPDGRSGTSGGFQQGPSWSGVPFTRAS